MTIITFMNIPALPTPSISNEPKINIYFFQVLSEGQRRSINYISKLYNCYNLII